MFLWNLTNISLLPYWKIWLVFAMNHSHNEIRLMPSRSRRYGENEMKYQLCIFFLFGRRRNGAMLKFKRSTISFSVSLCMCLLHLFKMCFFYTLSIATSEMNNSDSGVFFSLIFIFFSDTNLVIECVKFACLFSHG